MLRAAVGLADLVTTDLYGDYEAEVRKRLGTRDPDDWPILASALALGCRSGLTMQTSSDAALPLGHPIELRFSWRLAEAVDQFQGRPLPTRFSFLFGGGDYEALGSDVWSHLSARP
jgi:PIN domain